MKIIEKSSDRLVFRTGLFLVNHSKCIFDKKSGRAIIERVIFLWPRRKIDVPLNDVGMVGYFNISVRMEGSDIVTTIPQIILASGQVVRLSVLNGDTKSAPKLVEVVNEFLAL